ncbi:MAG: outer membrane lipoprotein-sorting protein [Bacteroidales bacterium]|nr:outer membrane lipoprotein-sorting protein [Bacteroidales bacterium]
MKTIKPLQSALLTVVLLFSFSSAFTQNATEIIKKADDKWNGEKSSQGTMTMTIVRPTWERTIQFKIWTLDRDYSMTLITAPAKEKGQAFLKRDTEMWNWMPSISRMIKLPPSMMADGWMGSDYTNDDVLKESSIVVDFNHSIIGSETIDGWDCWKIELLPKEDAAVVWGKIVKWISKSEYLQMKTEYYDEDEFLVKTELGTEIKTMDDRKIPSRLEIIPADKDNQKTIVTIDNIKFNVAIQNSFFSQQNMKRLR